MKSGVSIVRNLAVAAILTAMASVANAQVQRTFVSAQFGTDANANPSSHCGPTAPCRTFGAALGYTNPAGEIIVLDSGGYGTVTISQSVSIVAPPGIYAGVAAASSANGVTINTQSSDKVILRGLTIYSQGGTIGISKSTSGTLNVESCVINGFSVGLDCTGPGRVTVKNTTVRNCGFGVYLAPAQGVAVTASLDRVNLEASGASGLWISSGVTATMRDSIVSASGQADIQVLSGAELNAEGCRLANAAQGIHAQSGSIARISGSTVVNNGLGLLADSGATLLSRGNNTIEGNATNTVGTIGSYSAR